MALPRPSFLAGPSLRVKPACAPNHVRRIAMAGILAGVMAALAALLAPADALAQYATPADLRAVAPTIQDSDPGVEPDENAPLPAVYRRQAVFYRTDHPPGTIVIDTSERFLYLIQPNHIALRYGISVVREGYEWDGPHTCTRQEYWQDRTPPAATTRPFCRAGR